MPKAYLKCLLLGLWFGAVFTVLATANSEEAAMHAQSAAIRTHWSVVDTSRMLASQNDPTPQLVNPTYETPGYETILAGRD